MSINQLPTEFSGELKNKILASVEKLNCEEDPGVIQVSESYEIHVDDENWSSNSKLIKCPAWYSSILKSVPLSGLFFWAPEPEEGDREEHIFLDLPGWTNVAEMYPFFVHEMHKHNHYPIASSGYGYLVIGEKSTPNDPIYRWDGSGMCFEQAFENFSNLLDLAKPDEEDEDDA